MTSGRTCQKDLRNSRLGCHIREPHFLFSGKKPQPIEEPSAYLDFISKPKLDLHYYQRAFVFHLITCLFLQEKTG